MFETRSFLFGIAAAEWQGKKNGGGTRRFRQFESSLKNRRKFDYFRRKYQI